MKTKKFKKILFLFSSFFSLISLISCKESSNTIKIGTAQEKNWPLTDAMNKIIELYNEENKNTENFIKVEYLLSNQTKAKRESELAKNQFDAINNFPNDVYNIILNNPIGAFLINSKNRILNLENDVISANQFEENLAKLHTTVPGENINSNKLYSIPFDISDTNALIFNLDLMYLIFNLIKNNGGIVDENSNIYKKAEQASKSGADIPENSIFLALEAKNNDAFSALKINDNTFDNYDSILNFVRLFFNGIKINEEKLKEDTPEVNSIFGINYAVDTFLQDLNNISNNKKMWDLITNTNQNDSSFLNYAIKDDKQLQANFKNTLEKYIKNIKILEKNNKKIISHRYHVKDTRTGYEIRDYKMAFGFGFLVSKKEMINTFANKEAKINETKISPEKVDKILPNENDLYFLPQVTKTKNNDSKGSWWEGGSSLIPISVDNNGPKDKATKKFLKWLFNNKINYRNREINVTDLIPILSGYFFPSKNNSTPEYTAFLESLEKDRENLIKDELKKGIDKQDKNLIKELENEKINLSSAIISQKSLLNAIKKNDNLIYKLVDAEASAILKKIEFKLRDSSLETNIENNENFDSNKAYNEIFENILNSKE
ncbi:P68 family surface lipoprotein [[Mycoplasma] collis]|uniref:P68 family surface lipoprotein n=1 Tax=[Mycoplasma] collis TaxID=2127 RepID=UPI00051C687A|nr:hypothetical protein [[Mycoplasma] collis]